MTTCEFCGHVCDEGAVTVLIGDGPGHVFDCLRCAETELATPCRTCGRRLVERPLRVDGETYCSPGCAQRGRAASGGNPAGSGPGRSRNQVHAPQASRGPGQLQRTIVSIVADRGPIRTNDLTDLVVGPIERMSPRSPIPTARSDTYHRACHRAVADLLASGRLVETRVGRDRAVALPTADETTEGEPVEVPPADPLDTGLWIAFPDDEQQMVRYVWCRYDPDRHGYIQDTTVTPIVRVADRPAAAR